MTATNHWRRRVEERIGRVDADLLARAIVQAIQGGDERNVQFVARVNRGGGRLFRFRAGERQFFALVDTESWHCITVLPPGFVAAREGKNAIKLREKDL
jgi:hypothetical protein